MKKRTTFVLAGGAGLLATGAALAGVTFWTPWFSEEGQNWQACGSDYAVDGMRADGEFADNLSLGCSPWIFGSLPGDGDSANSYWSDWFSEEGDSGVDETRCAIYPDGRRECDTIPTGSNLHVCFGGFGPKEKGVITGMACDGAFCDNLSVQCKRPTSGVLGDCFWTGWFSEEQRQLDLLPGEYITGVECNHDYCDNMRFYVCVPRWPN